VGAGAATGKIYVRSTAIYLQYTYMGNSLRDKKAVPIDANKALSGERR
jgi:hypothetical protein